MQSTRISADLLFDGVRFLREAHTIEISDGKITRVSPGLSPDTALDARGTLIMPGLINTHAHVVRGGAFEATEPPLPLQSVANFVRSLARGTTTIADLGCPPPLIKSFRDSIRARPELGPDVVAAGPVVTAPQGYPFDWMPGWVAKLGAAIACEGERQAAEVARRVADAGMDFVKLAIMHRSYGDKPLRAVDVPTASALVTEAHRLGKRVLAHAHSNDDYRVALAAGVDALMHSSFEPLTDDLVRAVADAGIPVCPTLWVFESICALDDGEPVWASYEPYVGSSVMRSLRRFSAAYRASNVVPPGIAGGLLKQRVREAVENAAANLRILSDSGVPIIFGNDAAYGLSLVARPVDEISAMHRAGLSVETCLRAATSEASRALGLNDRGRIAPGQRADLIALPNSIESEIEAIGTPLWVMKAGTRVEERAATAPLLGAYARGLAATVRGAFSRSNRRVRARRSA